MDLKLRAREIWFRFSVKSKIWIWSVVTGSDLLACWVLGAMVLTMISHQVREIGELKERVEEGLSDNRVITQRYDQEAEKNTWNQEKITDLQVLILSSERTPL